MGTQRPVTVASATGAAAGIKTQSPRSLETGSFIAVNHRDALSHRWSHCPWSEGHRGTASPWPLPFRAEPRALTQGTPHVRVKPWLCAVTGSGLHQAFWDTERRTAEDSRGKEEGSQLSEGPLGDASPEMDKHPPPASPNCGGDIT